MFEDFKISRFQDFKFPNFNSNQPPSPPAHSVQPAQNRVFSIEYSKYDLGDASRPPGGRPGRVRVRHRSPEASRERPSAVPGPKLDTKSVQFWLKTGSPYLPSLPYHRTPERVPRPIPSARACKERVPPKQQGRSHLSPLGRGERYHNT